jgi:hypothetical protein
MNKAWSIVRSPGTFPVPSEKEDAAPEDRMKDRLDSLATQRFD